MISEEQQQQERKRQKKRERRREGNDGEREKEEGEGRREGREGRRMGGKVEGKKTRISKALLPRAEYFCLKDGYDADSRLKHLNTLFRCLVLWNCKNITAG